MDKRCIECNVPIGVPGLIVAMEQREHFALTRHTYQCDNCAIKLLSFIDRTASGSRHYHQCVNCIYCGSNLPIARFRFQIKDHPMRHVAVCEACYNLLREDLLRDFPSLVGFIEQEWHTRGLKKNVRMPWQIGSYVRVRGSAGAAKRFTGQVGKIVGFRALVQPWYGYTVVFPDGKQQFFHERDLEQVATPDFETTSRLKNIT